MKVKVQKLHPDAVLPRYATPGAACFDLHAVDVPNGYSPVYTTLEVGTGLAFEIPPGHVMLIYSRSGHGFKFDTRLANCVGVIDSDYRGEVRVKLSVDWLSASFLSVRDGDRIAQAMILPIPKVELVEADSLSETQRGTGGFGSTGTV